MQRDCDTAKEMLHILMGLCMLVHLRTEQCMEREWGDISIIVGTKEIGRRVVLKERVYGKMGKEQRLRASLLMAL